MNVTRCSDAEKLHTKIKHKLRKYSEMAKSDGILVPKLYFAKFNDQKAASSYNESLTTKEKKRVQNAVASWDGIQKSRCVLDDAVQASIHLIRVHC
jgi:hypothetical protein